MANWPLWKRKPASRVVVKLKRLSVQWWTLVTSSWLSALIVSRSPQSVVPSQVPDRVDSLGGHQI